MRAIADYCAKVYAHLAIPALLHTIGCRPCRSKTGRGCRRSGCSRGTNDSLAADAAQEKHGAPSTCVIGVAPGEAVPASSMSADWPCVRTCVRTLPLGCAPRTEAAPFYTTGSRLTFCGRAVSDHLQSIDARMHALRAPNDEHEVLRQPTAGTAVNVSLR